MSNHKQIIDFHLIPRDWHYLYRAEAHPTGDELWDGVSVQIYMREIQIVKYTPCGVWISEWGKERFVNLRAGRQYASTTEREAKLNLYYRKRRQLQIIAYQQQVAEIAVKQLHSELFQ